MKRSRLSYILIAMLCSVLGTRPFTSRGDSNLPRHPPSVSLELSLPGGRIEVRVPIVARVILTNRGNEPMTLRTREEGTPYAISLVTAHEDGKEKKTPLWLRRSGPSKHDVTLAPGEQISGEILLFDRDKGFPFDVRGKYRVSLRWTSRDGSENVRTDRLEVDALPPQEQNATCLRELQDLAIDYYANGAASEGRIDPVNMDEARTFHGNRLLAKIVGQQKPHLIDPQRNSADRKKAELVESLTDLLVRRPNSSYAGYVARYLGLVHLKTLEHEWSLAQRGSWKEAARETNEDDITRKVVAAYDKALHYLTVANEADTWPWATAIYYLGWLHIMTEEWDKVEACLRELRTKYAESDGVQRADELERQMAKYKAKLGRRKAAAP